MPWTSKRAQFDIKRIRALRKALAKGEDCGLETVFHQLSLTVPETDRAETYTVCLVHDEAGNYMATCRELPQVLAFDDSESGALAAARAAIKEAVAQIRH
jgi:hypothetical protein